MNNEQINNIRGLKSSFESAIEYCDSILKDPENSKSEFQWLIHDWSIKQQEGYNDSLMFTFEMLHNTYKEYHPND